MNWLQVDIDLDARDIEPVERALFAAGAAAVDLQDAANEPILEPAPDSTPIWPAVRLRAMFEASIDRTTIRIAVAAAMVGPALPAIRFATLQDRDWLAEWRRSLAPMRFGRQLWVCPAGTEPPDATGVVVQLEPGLAFGSGEHPTTALCLQWLADSRDPSASLLDFGCGSGILSVAALVLGARNVVAVDVDAQARTATRQNALRNGVADRLEICEPGADAADRPFDRIVANILSGTLIELSDRFRASARAGTLIALSGILTRQVREVADGYSPWVEFAPASTREDWALLTGIARDT